MTFFIHIRALSDKKQKGPYSRKKWTIFLKVKNGQKKESIFCDFLRFFLKFFFEKK